MALLLANCANIQNVQLGRDSPPFGPFGPAYAHTELGSGQDPTLTGDLLELYFVADRSGTTDRHDIWVAKRESSDEPFGTPELVPVLNLSSEQSSSAISTDGLTLWFSSNRAGGTSGMDIWVSTRTDRSATWNEPQTITELNTSGNELPRPLGNHDLQMPLSSTSSGAYYQLELATRASISSNWNAPVPTSEIADDAMLRYGGFLTDDGEMLLFSNESPNGTRGEIMRTWRLDTDEAFASPVSVGDGLNGPTFNRDPWLSPDGNHFFFSSDRTGSFMIYEADIDNDR